MAQKVRGRRLTLSPTGTQLHQFDRLVQRGKDEFGLQRQSIASDILQCGMEKVVALMDSGEYGRTKKGVRNCAVKS